MNAFVLDGASVSQRLADATDLRWCRTAHQVRRVRVNAGERSPPYSSSLQYAGCRQESGNQGSLLALFFSRFWILRPKRSHSRRQRESHKAENEPELKTSRRDAGQVKLRTVDPMVRSEHRNSNDQHHDADGSPFDTQHEFGRKLDIAMGGPPRRKNHQRGKDDRSNLVWASSKSLPKHEVKIVASRWRGTGKPKRHCDHIGPAGDNSAGICLTQVSRK